jgi:pimeloyl-ACP methyl ester carboxylesterase
MTKNIKKPSWFLNLTEAPRAAIEYVRCWFFMLMYPYKQKGNQQPVLVIPGLLGSDLSTAMLRRFLNKLGYISYPWDLGFNLGHIQDLEKLNEKLKFLFEKHQQKVVLIGWSLGGVYVREMAKENPAMVKQVVTLGSPFADLEAPNHARWVFEFLNGKDAIDQSRLATIPNPAPVPTTAFYSKQDGIVPWEACMEVEDDTHKNMEVQSSHIGLCRNASVLKVLVGIL